MAYNYRSVMTLSKIFCHVLSDATKHFLSLSLCPRTSQTRVSTLHSMFYIDCLCFQACTHSEQPSAWHETPQYRTFQNVFTAPGDFLLPHGTLMQLHAHTTLHTETFKLRKKNLIRVGCWFQIIQHIYILFNVVISYTRFLSLERQKFGSLTCQDILNNYN